MSETDLNTNSLSQVGSRSAAVLDKFRRLMSSPARHALVIVVSYTVGFLIFFSPTLVRGYLLAVGADGQHLYLPNYHARKVFWDTSIFAGFPMMADPQVMSWYPPALLLSQFPGTWNVFIVIAFVAASSFMYGYVYTLTKSRFAGLFSGIAFGMSGFMMAHLGHTVIIHTAAWIPLILWSLENLRQKSSAWWFIAGSFAIAMSFLGGHTPTFTYGFMLTIAYVILIGWKAPIGRWRYYSISLALVTLGLGLAAIQILATAEIVGLSVRTGYSFSDFVSHSLPLNQLLMLVFPKLFGALKASGAIPYYGAENLTELTGYVGLLSMMLAAIGILKWPQRSVSMFWLTAAFLSVPLAMGDATPLARVVYHIPVLNQFRAPGRYLLVFTLAGSVLSGLGISYLRQMREKSPFIWRVALFSSLLLLACVVIVWVSLNNLPLLAAHKEISPAEVLNWTRRQVLVGLIIFAVAVATLIYWYNSPGSPWRCALLVLVLVIDLGTFGFFYDWRYTVLDRNALAAPEIAARYRTQLVSSNQRALPIHGTLSLPDELPPNLSRVWGVPSASGYNSLILSRYSRLVSMHDVGSLFEPLWWKPEHQGMNLAGVRFLFMPRLDPLRDHQGNAWHKDDMQVALGSGCTAESRDSVIFNLPAPVRSSAISVVARLACSVQVPDSTEIAHIRITDGSGNVETQSFLAGRDASEWAYDCGSVKPSMKHQRAAIFRSYAARLYDEPCEGHYSVANFNLIKLKDVKSIELKWMGNPGTMLLDKVSLIDDANQTSFPVDPMTMGDRWRFVEETSVARVYENLSAMPRAWLVSQVASVDAEAALSAIKTSRLPDGSTFDPFQKALVEEPLALTPQDPDSSASAKVMELSDSYMEVQTSSKITNFLVTSDVYYPGWRVRIDGSDSRLLRANYGLRGVVVPSGEHLVRFEYVPRRLYLGAVVSLLSFLCLGLLALRRSKSSIRST